MCLFGVHSADDEAPAPSTGHFDHAPLARGRLLILWVTLCNAPGIRPDRSERSVQTSPCIAPYTYEERNILRDSALGQVRPRGTVEDQRAILSLFQRGNSWKKA